MSIHQTNKDKPRAQKCRHFCFSFDLHNYCPTCREAGKSDDPCVTSEAPCDICASFTDDQMKKIQHRKHYLKKQKADTNTKVDELDLLGEGDGDSFTCSNADLESATDNLFTSHPPPPNTVLLRREAEMTLLQPQLGETRRQELRNSSFWDPSLFQSQLVKEGEDFLLKKGTSKDSQGFAPYQNKPFRGPHNKRRGSYRKRPYGGNSSQSSNQSFSSERGKLNFRGSRGRFRPHNRGRGRGNPSSQ